MIAVEQMVNNRKTSYAVINNRQLPHARRLLCNELLSDRYKVHIGQHTITGYKTPSDRVRITFTPL